jgi:hypothetical protein
MAVFCIAANWFHNLSPFAQFRHDLALQPKNPLPQIGNKAGFALKLIRETNEKT